MRIARRALLAGASLATFGAFGACSRKDGAAAPPPGPSTLPLSSTRPVPVDAGEQAPRDAGGSLVGRVEMDVWSLDGGGKAAVLVPAWTGGQRLPLLLALHGRGEALKGPALGVLGWPRDYALVRAVSRIAAPPIVAADLEGFVDEARLARMNVDLASRPFGGMVVVCPYSPDVDLRKPADIRAYSAYVMNAVLPRARRELPVLGTPESTGIDGVSLGGALALRIGLSNAEAFGAVGSLQPAIGDDQVPEFLALVREARRLRPRLALRLLTSREDYFRGAIGKLSSALRAASIAHDYADVPGPHDYPFNRGPGAIEMLHWHDRALRAG